MGECSPFVSILAPRGEKITRCCPIIISIGELSYQKVSLTMNNTKMKKKKT